MPFYKNKPVYPFLFLLVFIIACNHNNKSSIKDKELVTDPSAIDTYISENIKKVLDIAAENKGKVNDSLQLSFYKVLRSFYNSGYYKPVWSSTEKWDIIADSLLQYINNAALDGLFRDDYHFKQIDSLKNILSKDSLKRMDAVLWAKADVLMTDAFMHIIRDLKQGRLQPDSLCRENDSSRYELFFTANLQQFQKEKKFSAVVRSLEPSIPLYASLKSGIRNFIDSMDTKTYTYVVYPYKAGDKKDSAAFVKKLQLRFSESGIMEYTTSSSPDSLTLANAVKKYQKSKNITADGKITTAFIRQLNTTDKEKYNRIAITLDRYKSLPDSMPKKYIWVNLPSFYLQVWDGDTVSFTSRIICGKPATPTPLLTSNISDIVIYPTWTVPSSIIAKEMLPGLKRNSGYLARKGLHLLNDKGEKIDPSTINWSKYSKGIPYKIQQGSGDDNALGIIKFNFNNPFSVYLHDTNQRYLFKNIIRSLSHGCVRVQEWEKLAFFIIRNDSLQAKPKDTLKYNTDSVTKWIANKERHRIDVKNKMPLFIRYFGCEGINGSIRFYDDIYGEDKLLKEKYFAGKSLSF